MKYRESHYLEFDNLEVIPRIAGLLPRELAIRYHALPVADDGKRITVAMADPNDNEAREAIIAVLGPSTLIVRTNAQFIDKLLAEFWDKATNRPLELLLWLPKKSITTGIETYAEYIATLLGAHLNHFETADMGDKAYRALVSVIEDIKADIVVLGEWEQTIMERLIQGSLENILASQMPASLLVVRHPIHPIKNILLILRNDAIVQTSLNWTIGFARPSGAEVTILPITIPLPAMYDHNPRMRCSIDSILTSNSRLGKKLRLVAQQLVDSEINGTLRIRQEAPTWQIHCELLEHNYDLVVIDSEPPNKLWHWIQVELVNPLLNWSDKSVLVTKSSTMQVT